MADRKDVKFRSSDASCAAWLYMPDGAGPHPLIVMAHGLGSVREMRLDAYAERFCDAGYAALVFDYRHFGASEGQPRQLLDISKQLEDWRAAVEYARRCEGVDPDRIILWGTSFSGGHVIQTGARDPRVAAVLSQCPFTDGRAKGAGAAPDLGGLLKVAGLAIADSFAAKLGLPPVKVKLVGSRGAAALMTAPDAEAGYLGLVPAGFQFKNYVAARVALQIGSYRPGKDAAGLRCPSLFCICETDSVAPASASIAYAKEAPRSEIYLCPEGHFEIYQGAAFEHVIRRQLDFLRKHVPPRAAHQLINDNTAAAPAGAGGNRPRESA